MLVEVQLPIDAEAILLLQFPGGCLEGGGGRCRFPSRVRSRFLCQSFLRIEKERGIFMERGIPCIEQFLSLVHIEDVPIGENAYPGIERV